MANLKLSDRGMIWNSDLVETLGENTANKCCTQYLIEEKSRVLLLFLM